jgi:DNA-nicking Smr family endonuclease
MLEERARRRLARGVSEVEAWVDLHGMTQERAFAALVAFLRNAQKRGARLVLVITGKGGEQGAGRGVLRRSVPAWLARPDLRHLVVGFEEAQRRHGGAGALYVRVRKRRIPVSGQPRP